MTLIAENLPADHMFKTVPYKHQLDAFMAGRDKKFYAYLMEMGTGKTKVCIDNSAYLFNNGKINGLVIIAPKSICRNWSQKEIPTHMPDNIDRRVVLWGSETKKLLEELETLYQPEPLKLHILIMNVEAISTDRGYDALERFLRCHDAFMAIDESTIIKNPKADRSKIAMKLGRQARYRRIMTGSPVTQSPLDVFSQFEFLEHGCLGSFTFSGFRTQYAVLQRKHINGRSFDIVVGYQRLNHLQEVLKQHSYRVLKKDCLDLPDKIYTVRNIELTSEQKAYYKSLREDALAMLANGDVVAAPLVITQLLRLRQALCNIAPKSVENADEEGSNDAKKISGLSQEISKTDPRAEEVMNIVEEAGGAKIIIWASFVPSIVRLLDMLEKRYPGRVGCIYGAVPQETRADFVARFQGERIIPKRINGVISSDTNEVIKIPPEKQIDYIVAHPRTGGYGLTLTEASVVVYYNNDYSLEVREQSEDRAHRIGQKKNVTYIDLVTPGTIDEKIRTALVNKRDLAREVTGDKLCDMMRELLL